jgi:hypothetical protein
MIFEDTISDLPIIGHAPKTPRVSFRLIPGFTSLFGIHEPAVAVT